MAVKTMLLEGAGNFVGITSLRYDDDIGFKSAIEQLRDWRRAYDLANGRARFELTRMVEYPFYIGDAPTRTIQGLDGKVAFNINPANQNATPAFGNQANGRRLDYLRHPLTLVRAALGPDAKLSNSRTQGTERMVDIAIDDLPTLTLAISTTTKLPTRIFQMVDNNIIGDTMEALEFTDYKAVNGLQLPTLLHELAGQAGNRPDPHSTARRSTATSAISRRPRRSRRRTRRAAAADVAADAAGRRRPGTRRRNSPRGCGSSPARRITA